MCFLCARLYSQESNENIAIQNFKDTLPFVQPTSFYVKSLDCFDLQPLDTIRDLPWLPKNNPILVYFGDDAIVFSLHETYKNSFAVWYFQTPISFQHLEKPKPAVLNRENNQAVIIYWSWDSGMSSIDGFGNSTHEKGFFIFDIRSITMLAYFKTYSYNAYWERNKIDENWENYAFEIEEKRIRFTEKDESPDAMNKLKRKPKTPLTFNFLLEPTALIKEK